MSNRTFVFLFAITTLVIAILTYLLQPRWTGINNNHLSQVIGHYSSYEACREDVQKIGGWCGERCTEYAGGAVADCNPLIKVEKLK